jgi:single-strand DNA-binding protein
MSDTKNQFQIAGRLHEVSAEQQVSEKFRKREFILEIVGQYPEYVKFQLVQDKCAVIEPFQVGDFIQVDFNLRGRNFTKGDGQTNFTNLEAWRIKAAEEERPKSQF